MLMMLMCVFRVHLNLNARLYACNSLFYGRIFYRLNKVRQKMDENNVECVLKPRINPNHTWKGKHLHLSDMEEITIGRGNELGIMDLSCSKKQLILEVDSSTKTVKIRRIGRNPSILAGIPLEHNQIYTAREGMILQVAPNVEFMIVFQEKKDYRNQPRRSNEEPLPQVKKKLATKFSWSVNPTGTVLCCQTNDIKYGSVCKIASFDLDGNLISTKSGHTFPSNDEDWKLWHSSVPLRLKTLIDEGYSLVMFTNQAQLEISSATRKETFKRKIENVINSLDVPITVLIATARDIYRKPCTGMWDFYISKVTCKVDVDASFYVGDAAGRLAVAKPKKSADFDVTDRLFARNIGITFYTPEEFFLKEQPRPFKDVNFHPQELPQEAYPELNIPSHPSEVIIMVGSPASGKSYFAREILETKGYTRISRDELKVWTKCRDKLINAISRQQNVVYDATNPDKGSRKIILDVMSERNFTNIRCFVMTTSEERCVHNNRFRQLVHNSIPVPHTAIVTFNKRFEEPTVEEGFISIVKVPFVPKFQCVEEEQLYKKYLLGRKSRRT